MGGKTLPVGRQELPEAGGALRRAPLPGWRKRRFFNWLEKCPRLARNWQ
jgi:hypothetical protein